jgi:hemolysin III
MLTGIAVNPSLRSKPKLRGASHLVAALAAAPAAVALWARAVSQAGRLGAAVYGISLVGLFTISALYHRQTWRPRARDLLGRVDQATIFLLIAGTYTPFGLLLGPSVGQTLLRVMWSGALCGMGLAFVWPGAPKPLMAAIYVVYGWSFVFLAPSFRAAAGSTVLELLILGALVYTAGAVIYALKRPDPFPRIFGYHEVFHLFVIAAAVLHFAAVARALPAIG